MNSLIVKKQTKIMPRLKPTSSKLIENFLLFFGMRRAIRSLVVRRPGSSTKSADSPFTSFLDLTRQILFLMKAMSELIWFKVFEPRFGSALALGLTRLSPTHEPSVPRVTISQSLARTDSKAGTKSFPSCILKRYPWRDTQMPGAHLTRLATPPRATSCMASLNVYISSSSMFSLLSRCKLDGLLFQVKQSLSCFCGQTLFVQDGYSLYPVDCVVGDFAVWCHTLELRQEVFTLD